ncbi:hypothetical protein MIMGU_mgv1a013899mg [Erythranthe guttata]|uniref:Uncharacterized protein n=1 Tax=Erythranthe guttata TaxID=4155 RepID=A0A022QPK3_ERYGU|nr:hypothetical protein MIMGU_mgv1a013899mg [Erythranthe guttata]
MAKIQKQNETCESEGLRNWKEDQAKKAGRKNVDGQLKVQLHVKISPQNNRFVKGKRHQERNKRDHFLTRPTYVHELRKRNGNEHEHPTQNVDGVEQPNEKQGDVQEQPGQKSDVVKELPKQNFDAPKQLNEESDEEGEIVPVVIRPGHIRFEPMGKGPAFFSVCISMFADLRESDITTLLVKLNLYLSSLVNDRYTIRKNQFFRFKI